MEKLFNWISILIGFTGGVALQLIGAWDTALKVLVAMMILDYATGVIKGICNKKLSSNIGFKGILKKIVILIVVCTANVIQVFAGDAMPIREMVIVFYIANEGISLLENAAEFIPLPESLKEILLQLRDKSSGEMSRGK